jgi:hypothetical protein
MEEILVGSTMLQPVTLTVFPYFYSANKYIIHLQLLPFLVLKMTRPLRQL